MTPWLDQLKAEAAAEPEQRRPPLAARGLRWRDGWRGAWRLGGVEADVRLLASGLLRVAARLADPAAEAEQWLRWSARWPGDFRVSRRRGGVWAVGEFRAAPPGRLRRWTPRVRRTLLAAVRGQPLRERAGSLTEAAAAAAVERAASPDRLTSLDGAWSWRLGPPAEFRPVIVRWEAGALRLESTVASWPADAVRARAAAEYALRVNARLRLARISLGPRGLSAETRVEAGDEDPGWLRTAGWAVAAAARFARPVLEELVANSVAAAWCAAVLVP